MLMPQEKEKKKRFLCDIVNFENMRVLTFLLCAFAVLLAIIIVYCSVHLARLGDDSFHERERLQEEDYITYVEKYVELENEMTAFILSGDYRTLSSRFPNLQISFIEEDGNKSILCVEEDVKIIFSFNKEKSSFVPKTYPESFEEYTKHMQSTYAMVHTEMKCDSVLILFAGMIEIGIVSFLISTIQKKKE